MGEKKEGGSAKKAAKAGHSPDAHEQERHDLAHTMTRGTALKFGSLAIVKGLSLVYQILILRMLSPVEAGLFFLANGFVTIVSQFMALGFPSATNRFAPLYAGKGEKERLKKLVWTLSVTTIAISLLVFLVFIVFGQAIADAYGQPIGPVMPWVAVLSLLFMLFNFWSNMLDSLKYFGKSALLQVAQNLLRVGLTFGALVLIARTADVAFGTYAITLGVLTLYLIWYLWGWLSALPGKLAYSFHELAESMRFGIPAYLSSIVDVLTTNMDVILVGRFLGLEAVAAYSAIIIFVRNIAPFVLSPVGAVQQPLLVEQHARGSRLYGELVREGSRWTMYLGVPFLMLFLLYSTAILGIVSPKYLASAGLIWFFAPMVLLVLLSNSSRGALFAQGRSGVLFLVSTMILVLNFALNWLFIPLFGLMGSALATSLSVVCGELTALLLARHLAGAKLHPDIFKCVAAGALMLVVGFVPVIPASFAGGASTAGAGALTLSSWAVQGGAGLAAAVGVSGYDIAFSAIALGVAMSVSALVYVVAMYLLKAISEGDKRMVWSILMRYIPNLGKHVGKPSEV